MEVDKQLYEEIKEYCSLNGLKPREFANSLLRKAFMEEKYGIAPAVVKKPTTIIEERPKVVEIPTDLRQEFEDNVGKVVIEPLNTDNHDKSGTKISENKDTQIEKKQTIKKRKL